MTDREPNTDAPPSMRSTVPLLALGANTWLVAAGWPLLTSHDGTFAPWLASGVALVALCAGAALQGYGDPTSARTRLARDAALWLVFPIATSAATASACDAAGDAALPLLPLLLGPLSACAFGAALVAATSPAPPLIAIELVPLRSASVAPSVSALHAALPRVLFGAGALVIGLVLPALGTEGALAERWGEGSRPGSVLQAILGGALAVALLASFLPSALRRDARDAEPRPDAAQRTAWFLFLSLLGAVTFYVVQS